MVTVTYRGHETVNSKVLESYIPPRENQSTTLPDSLAALDTVRVLKYRARDIQPNIIWVFT